MESVNERILYACVLQIFAHAYYVDAAVTPKAFSIRLRGSSLSYAGRVEVKLGEGDWGTVCDEGWSLNDARILCGQLGFKDAEAAIRGSAFGPGPGSVWITNVRCLGNEDSLHQCTYRRTNLTSQSCDVTKGAGVLCTPNEGMRLEFIIIIGGVSLLMTASVIVLVITIHQVCCRRKRPQQDKITLTKKRDNMDEEQDLGRTNGGVEFGSDEGTLNRAENIKHENHQSTEGTSEQIKPAGLKNNQTSNKGYMKLNRRSLAYFYMKLKRGRKRDSQGEFMETEQHKYYAIRATRPDSTAEVYEQIDEEQEKDNKRQSLDSDYYVRVTETQEGEEGNRYSASPEYLEILPTVESNSVKRKRPYEYIDIIPKTQDQERSKTMESGDENGENLSKDPDENVTDNFLDRNRDESNRNESIHKNLKDSDEAENKNAVEFHDYVELVASDDEMTPESVEEITNQVLHKKKEETELNGACNEPDYLVPNLTAVQEENVGYNKDLPLDPSEENSEKDAYAKVIPKAERGGKDSSREITESTRCPPTKPKPKKTMAKEESINEVNKRCTGRDKSDLPRSDDTGNVLPPVTPQKPSGDRKKRADTSPASTTNPPRDDTNVDNQRTHFPLIEITEELPLAKCKPKQRSATCTEDTGKRPVEMKLSFLNSLEKVLQNKKKKQMNESNDITKEALLTIEQRSLEDKTSHTKTANTREESRTDSSEDQLYENLQQTINSNPSEERNSTIYENVARGWQKPA